jgi:flavin-dependent dehydrogenase
MVVGGGPAGAAAALTLARSGRRVIVADAGLSRTEASALGESLIPAARPLLRELGVLDSFVADGHLASYGTIACWGSDIAHETDFMFDPHGHGWHLDRTRFDAMLLRAAQDAGAELFARQRLTSATREGEFGWRVFLDGPGGDRHELRCAWLIDATGRRCSIARAQGASRTRQDRLVAFHALVATTGSSERDGRTMVEAVSDGWWYTSLLPSGARVVAFLTDADLAYRQRLLSPEGFARKLRQTQHVGAKILSGASMRPRGTAAQSQRLAQFGGVGWIAVGDAALAFDPLSSQGMFNALYTGLRAGRIVHQALSSEHHTSISPYETELEAVHSAYCRNRISFYSIEARWPESPFWRRRQMNDGST